jgi:catechol 2,3-dioxygenase-like lactoylglutathione lyase family enzyme
MGAAMVKRLSHVGISVANLDRSIEFYCKGLGMDIVEQGAFAGDNYENILRLAGARGKTAMLKAHTLQLELFEFTHPVPRASDPARPVCDHGITHFCIEVDDIVKAYAQLIAAGGSFHCGPIEFIGVGLATYGRDPDGNVFELLEMDDARV